MSIYCNEEGARLFIGGIEMERKKGLALMKAWLKRRLGVIFFSIFLMLEYLVVGALMHINLESILYGSLLGVFIGICLLIVDYTKFVKKYQALLNTYHNRIYSLESLPETKEILEQSYSDIIKALGEDLSGLRSRMKKHEEEADDYYTLWTHQIKTPIAAMRLILQNQPYEENLKIKEERLLLEGELFKIEQYAEMALQYLRLESMSQDLVLKKYRLYDIVANALKKYAVYFMRKNLELSIEEFDATVITDEKWLQFVIEQLLSNSVKYTPQGKITIKMEDEQTLVIQDTGMGIHSEDIPRIFERGFTGYNGRMDKKSTGIGLYLCKKVTGKLSHTLKIQSSVGKGTTVKIGFQVHKEALILQE